MMPKEPKKDSPGDSTTDKSPGSSWAHDQKNKDYYYDDTCGYAVFEDEADLESNEEEDVLTGELKEPKSKS